MAENAEGIGLVLYNPPHAKRVWTPENIGILAQRVPNLIGLKTAGGDDAWYERMRSHLSSLSVFVPGHLLASGVKRGAQGAYSNAACLNPIAAQKWYDMMNSDMDGALELEARLRSFMDLHIAPFITEQKYCNAACDRFMALLGGWADVGPNVPDGTGVFLGVNPRTFTAQHFARAAMEGVTLGMNYGLRRLAELGVKAKQIRATGGGANSKLWRQIMADIFSAEVVTLKVGEGAAYGAALQALWCWRLEKGEKACIADITDEFVTLNTAQTAMPKKDAAAAYQELQALQDELSKSLRGVFPKHRQFVLR